MELPLVGTTLPLKIMDGREGDGSRGGGKREIRRGAISREGEVESLLIGRLRQRKIGENGESSSDDWLRENLTGQAQSGPQALIIRR